MLNLLSYLTIKPQFFALSKIMLQQRILFFLFFIICHPLSGQVQTGIDGLFSKQYEELLRGKRVGLITNQTGINSNHQTTIVAFKNQGPAYHCTLKALFAPEHGLNGAQHADEKVQNGTDADGIPIYSLHGTVRRPTREMLKNLTLLVYD